MLRLCTKNNFYQTKVLFQPLSCETITSKFKFKSNSHNNVTRSYAVTLKEESNPHERIYYGPLTPQIKGVKVFSLSSSMAGLMAQPIIIREAASIGSTSLLVAICSVVGFFTFITPLLLHVVTKKYVTEIHYDPTTSTYTATTINFFLARKKLEFNADDVVVPDIPGLFTTVKVKGVPLFIEARHFNDPWYYAKIMGYDKPMDFKLGEHDTDGNDKK